MTEEQLERLEELTGPYYRQGTWHHARWRFTYKDQVALRALLTEHEDLKAGRLKMYVWTDQVSFLAVAHAVSVAAAREQVLTYELTGGDGSCVEREKAREYVMNQSPAIYVGPNTEFTLSDSGELREQEDYSEQLYKQVKELEATAERQRKALRALLQEIVTVEEGNTEVNEEYWEVRLDNQIVWSMGGPRPKTQHAAENFAAGFRSDLFEKFRAAIGVSEDQTTGEE